MTKKILPDEKKSDLPIAIVDRFFPVSSQEKTPGQLPLFQVSSVLLNQGISPSHLRQAVAVLIGSISSKIGDPVPIVITEDEGAGAIEFLDACLHLIPEDSWVDISSLRAKKVLPGLGNNDKTAICYEGDQFKPELVRILSGVERGATLRQGMDGKGGSDSLPGSFIALVKDLNNPILQNRYVTRVHISADSESKKRRIRGMAVKSGPGNSVIHEIESACLRTLFRRVTNIPVDVEFAEKILNDSAIKTQNAVPLFDLSLRFLRNITRINNVMPVRPYEFQASFVGLNYDTFYPKKYDEMDRLIATKIDYYYFLTIFGDFLRSGDDFLTSRQRRIYDAILQINLRNYAKSKKQYPTELDYLNYQADQADSDTWVSRKELFKFLSSQPTESFSKITLHNELQELHKNNLIIRRRRKRRTFYEYLVNELIEYTSLFNTNLAEISDSRYKGEPAEVVNIRTGALEKI